MTNLKKNNSKLEIVKLKKSTSLIMFFFTYYNFCFIPNSFFFLSVPIPLLGPDVYNMKTSSIHMNDFCAKITKQEGYLLNSSSRSVISSSNVANIFR